MPTIRRFVLPGALLLLLFLASVEDALACSIAYVSRLEVRCGTEQVILSEQRPSSDFVLQGAFDGIAGACGETPESLEQFFSERSHHSGVFVLWSPVEEAKLAAARNHIDFKQCYYQDYERVGDWLRTSSQTRSYCYDAGLWNSLCFSQPEASPLTITLFILTTFGIGPLPLGLFAVAAMLLLFVYLADTHAIRTTLRPRLFSVGSGLALSGGWLWFILHGKDIESLIHPVVWMNLIFLLLLGYFVASLTSASIRWLLPRFRLH